MSKDNETFAKIVKRVRKECNSYPLPNAAGEKLKLVREMDDAHRRDIAAKDEEIARWREKALHEGAVAEALRSEYACLQGVVKGATVTEGNLRAEIVRLCECLREATEWACGNHDESCGDCVAHGGDTPCKCEKWRKALEEGGAEDGANNLLALVKNLANALNASCECHLPCDGCEMADESKFDCPEKAYRALVAKAREACK